MRQRPAMPGDQLHLGVVDPDRVRAAEPGPQHPHPLQMRRQRHPVLLQRRSPLHRRLREMGLHRQPEFHRQIAAAPHEFIRTMQRDRRRDPQTDLVGRDRTRPRQPRRIGARIAVGRGGPHRLRHRPQFRRERIQQSRNCLIETPVRDHRRDHRPHADIAVRPRHLCRPSTLGTGSMAARS